MHKVQYYSDRILKRLFKAQTGPLPEPEPMDASRLAVSSDAALSQPVLPLPVLVPVATSPAFEAPPAPQNLPPTAEAQAAMAVLSGT